MLTHERRSYILAVLERDGRVVAKQVSQALGLSEDTIRRDLRELAADGRLQRVHGGALPSSPALVDYAERTKVSPESKAAVGRRAAGLVRPGQVIFLDGGTTAVQVARHLAPDLRATVVTHSPSVAVVLAAHPSVEVELIGGRLFKHSVVTVGAAAVEAITRVRADVFFMGVTGVHPEAGLTTGDAEEAAVKRALARQAAETVVLASAEKIGAASPYLVLPVAAVGTIIVDNGLSEEVAKTYRALGVTLLTA
ncbi:DeoR/GlpR family DNA-binding transcription regulator [Acidisphaera sp. S103]|uniref:DeoR/GlpR family DNA-binding transcription regulator n=1 Tax=Acidisphaera sp. S103 TaxID=1747223 RepID=UPI00131D42D7|nr:DeoR/GlpR family DNA-binding transcription regulator [Acidisphaera sp. S103]